MILTKNYSIVSHLKNKIHCTQHKKEMNFFCSALIFLYLCNQLRTQRNHLNERIRNIRGEGRNRRAGGTHYQTAGRSQNQRVSRRAGIPGRYGRSRYREAVHPEGERPEPDHLCGKRKTRRNQAIYQAMRGCCRRLRASFGGWRMRSSRESSAAGGHGHLRR